MLVMNSQGIFFLVGNFMDYDTYVRKLSDVCSRFDVVWKGEEVEDYVVRCDCGNTYVHNADNLECSECEK